MKVKVISTGEGYSSIWLYSKNLCEIDNKNISVLYEHTGGRTLFHRIKRDLQMEVNHYFGNVLLRNKLKNENYDILHYSYPMITPVRTKKIQIISMHDNPNMLLYSDLYADYSLGNILAKKFMKSNINKYKGFENVLANSNYVKKSLLEYGFIGNVETIYFPIAPYFKKLQDKNRLRKELGLPERKTLLLSVSTNARRKNPGAVKTAMEMLPDNFALVRVGTPIGNSTTFQNVSNEKLNKIYNACDVLLMPSIEEGLGLPVIEGFATGIPVVASDIEVFHEIGGDAIEYINPMDVQSLIDGIKNVIENKDEMIIKGEKIVPKFSFDVFKENMLAYYRKLL